MSGHNADIAEATFMIHSLRFIQRNRIVAMIDSWLFSLQLWAELLALRTSPARSGVARQTVGL